MNEDFIIEDHVLVKYNGSSAEPIIPEDVTQIGREAFKDCTAIQKIVLPHSVRDIQISSFIHCTNLVSVEFSDSLETIGGSAFEDCTALKEVKLRQNVKTIGDRAFFGCSRIEKVSLPNGLETIGGGAFFKCTGIQSIHIPDSIKVLNACAFGSCLSLKYVEMPAIDQDYTIDCSTFRDCPGLKDENGMTILADAVMFYDGPGGEVTVPEGIKSVFPDVFRYGHWARDIYWEREDYFSHGPVTKVHLPTTLKGIESGAFAGCNDLHEIDLPEELKTIGRLAFSRAGLTAVQIPDHVEEIREELFLQCEELGSVHLGARVRAIDVSCFRDCGKLKKISISPENEHFLVRDGLLLNNTGDVLIYCPPKVAGKDYSIPPYIREIGTGAFSECWDLEKITIPETVQKIGDRVFPQENWYKQPALSQICIALGAGKKGIGRSAIYFEKGKTPLTFPELPVDFLKEPSVRIRLAQGYCLHPELYSEEYATGYRAFAEKNKEKILSRADAASRNGIEQYFDAHPAEFSACVDEKIDYTKLKGMHKVFALEKAVMSGDVQKTEKVIEGCGTFEFMSRALGIACEYGTLPMVKLLVEHGAVFTYDWSDGFSRKYGSLPFDSEFQQMLCGREISRFGTNNLPEIPIQPNSGEERASILAYLLEDDERLGMDLQDLLLYAALYGADTVVALLREHNVTIDPFAIHRFFANHVLELKDFQPSHIVYTIQMFSQLLQDEKLEVTQGIFYKTRRDKTQEVYENMFDPQVLKTILKLTDVHKLKKIDLLKIIVDQERIPALSILAEEGWISKTKQRDQLIEYAMSSGKNQALAWLLDYKNRTADLSAEAEKKEKQELKALNENPLSLSAMRKIWRFEEKPDGTLTILSYKGQDTEVIVPEEIGKKTVTEIGEYAFAAKAYGKRISNQEVRQKLTRVTLPESVQSIGPSVFSECTKLKSVNLPRGLKKLKREVFHGCTSLKQINLPEGLETIEYGAFEFCSSLANIVFPKTLSDIGPDAFARCRSLIEVVFPDSLKSLGHAAFMSCRNLQRVFLPTASCKYGGQVFDDCKKLIKNEFLIIDGHLFKYTGNSSVVTVPENVKAIETTAFRPFMIDSHNLTQVILPEGLERIGDGAFAERQALAAISFPQGLKTIGSDAFFGCGLKELVLPESLEEIGNNAFRKISATEIKIPKAVRSIGDSAFSECKMLGNLYFEGDPAILGVEMLGEYKENFSGYHYVPQGVHVHVKNQSGVEEYMKRYGDHIVLEPDMKE